MKDHINFWKVIEDLKPYIVEFEEDRIISSRYILMIAK